MTIYYAFDLLAEHDRDWRPEPYHLRRQRLHELFAGVTPPLQLVPATDNRDEALRWLDPSSALVGIEGLLVKARDQAYRAGRTADWRKIRSVGRGPTWRAVLAGEWVDAVRDGCGTRDEQRTACRSQGLLCTPGPRRGSADHRHDIRATIARRSAIPMPGGPSKTS